MGIAKAYTETTKDLDVSVIMDQDQTSFIYDENGELIPSDIEDRLISTPLEKLRAMDNVVGLAAGAQKVEAIRAVLRGGYLDVLITDEPTAALLLKGE